MHERTEEVWRTVLVLAHLHWQVEGAGGGVAGGIPDGLVAALDTEVDVLAEAKHPSREVAAMQLDGELFFHEIAVNFKIQPCAIPHGYPRR